MIGYIYSIFQGGMLSVTTVQQGSDISLSVDMSNLLILFLLPPVVGIVKAVVQTAGFKRLQGSSDKKAKPVKKETPETEVPETPEEPSAEVSESTDSAE